MKIVSKAQASRIYRLHKEGKISHSDMMKSVHETGDMSKLPERVGNTQEKKKLAIEGLV